MPDPERDLEIPPFPIEELLTSQDREDIKSCAEDLVSSSGEEPTYLTKPQMDERLESLRGFKGSFLETGDPLAAGELNELPPSVFEEAPKVEEVETVEKVDAKTSEAVSVVPPEPPVKMFEEAPDSKVAEEGVLAGGETEVEEIEEIEAVTAAPPPLPNVDERPDRRVSLVFFGAGLVAVGALWALIGALLFLAQERASGFGGAGAAATVWCGVWALVYLVLGFGNVFLKRWGRSLSVVTGWVWMAIGVVAVVAIGLFFTELSGGLEADGLAEQISSGGGENLLVGVLGTVALMAIFIPGIMILYASAPSVKATSERWDGSECWTDRRSYGMLVFGGVLACVAFWFGAITSSDWSFLWYGAAVDGLAAQQVYAGVCGAALVLAVLTVDLRRGIWWVLLVGILAGAAVIAGPWVMLLAGGAGGVDLEVFEPSFDPLKTGGLVIGIWAALLVFVLFLRRCLPKSEVPPAGSKQGQDSAEGSKSELEGDVATAGGA